MTRIPTASNTIVFTSASSPCGGISFPFHRKVTPAAFPTLATISRLARTDVCAGAMSVSWFTVFPSADTEIQEFSVARITSVSEGAATSTGPVVTGRAATLFSPSADGFVDPAAAEPLSPAACVA